ncbi:ABC transporter permease, partial [Patulibacter sp. NPDC049589]
MSAAPLVTAVATPWGELPDLLLPAYGQTAVMVGTVMLVVVLLGLPAAVLVHNTGPDGLAPNPPVHRALGAVLNLGRSLPFL